MSHFAGVDWTKAIRRVSGSFPPTSSASFGQNRRNGAARPHSAYPSRSPARSASPGRKIRPSAMLAERFEQAVVAAERSGSGYEEACAHHGLGELANADGDPRRAREQWSLALDGYRRLGALRLQVPREGH